MFPFVNIVIKSPSLTVPDTVKLTEDDDSVIVVPDAKVVLSIIKLGLEPNSIINCNNIHEYINSRGFFEDVLLKSSSWK